MNKMENRPEELRTPELIDFYGDDAGQFGKDVAADTLAIWDEIERLDLARHVGELEIKGLTVIPPEKVTTPEFVTRLRSKILEIAERRTGRPFDLTGTKDHGGYAPLGAVMLYMLYDDPVFQEALMNPVLLAMTDYLVGKNAVTGTCDANIKGPNSGDLAMHADHFMTPPPFGSINNDCNNTYALTDYNEENGALCYVPGSHHYRRQPLPGEGVNQRVIVNAKAGSLIVWNGSVWHGAVQRKTQGLRVSLSMSMLRPNIRPYENYTDTVTQEILDRHPPRFAKLVGKHVKLGWKNHEGPEGGSVGFDIARHAYE